MEKQQLSMNTAAQQAGGNYDKLSEENKKQFLKLSSGNEAAARNLTHALSGKDHEPWKGGPPPGGKLPEGNTPPGQ